MTEDYQNVFCGITNANFFEATTNMIVPFECNNQIHSGCKGKESKRHFNEGCNAILRVAT